MNADQLRAAQGPLKEQYKQDPASAKKTLRAAATLLPGEVACRLDDEVLRPIAGLHPAAGGDGSQACSAELLLGGLATCAGVTLRAVATALAIPVTGGRVVAEGDMDFRGTLGVAREVPIGITDVRLRFELEGDITPEQEATLLKLVERYCVVYQTLKNPPGCRAEIVRA
jgi:uncharacterized OsmC-like protein